MDFVKLASNNKQGIIIAVLIMAIGMGAYFYKFGFSDLGGMEKPQVGVFDGIRLKVAYAPEGAMKVFALAKNNELVKYRAAEGANLPETDSMVVGATEAGMMREEKLFSSTGDTLKGFFGIDTKIGGVLAKTGTQADMFHFLSPGQFAAIDGEEGKVFVRLDDEKSPDLIYYLPIGGKLPPKFEFAEGKLADYKTHELGGETFYPMILGAEEAKMMREEKEFSKIGDLMRGELRTNVVVVGVLKPSNSAMDMAHIVPLGESELQ